MITGPTALLLLLTLAAWRCQSFVFPAGTIRLSTTVSSPRQQQKRSRTNAAVGTAVGTLETVADWRRATGRASSAPRSRRRSNSSARTMWQRSADAPRLSLQRRRNGDVGVVRMSVHDMIGADVESGGLFDPLGEDEEAVVSRGAPWVNAGRAKSHVCTACIL